MSSELYVWYDTYNIHTSLEVTHKNCGCHPSSQLQVYAMVPPYQYHYHTIRSTMPQPYQKQQEKQQYLEKLVRDALARYYYKLRIKEETKQKKESRVVTRDLPTAALDTTTVVSSSSTLSSSTCTSSTLTQPRNQTSLKSTTTPACSIPPASPTRISPCTVQSMPSSSSSMTTTTSTSSSSSSFLNDRCCWRYSAYTPCPSGYHSAHPHPCDVMAPYVYYFPTPPYHYIPPYTAATRSVHDIYPPRLKTLGKGPYSDLMRRDNKRRSTRRPNESKRRKTLAAE